jgi:serine protease Do
MRYIAVLLLSLFLVGCQQDMTTNQVYNKVVDGTVAVQIDMGNGQGGMGTGFIIGENEIITNDHVTNHKGKMTISSRNSERKYEAEIVATDSVADISLLKLKDWESYKKNEAPTIVVLGNSDKARVGDKIIVVGHPWGLMWSVSEGIISAKNRRVDTGPKFLDQVDAHLYQGNSGGPIFNAIGQVVCVSNIMVTREGGSYGLCIPSNFIKKVVYDMKTLKEVRWRSLNLSLGMTDDGANVVVKEVIAKGAAEAAGIKVGDKILSISTPKNHPYGVKVKSADDLISELAILNGDSEVVKLTIERDGKKIPIEVKTSYRTSKEFS